MLTHTFVITVTQGDLYPMKDVLIYIERKKEQFSDLPFFSFLQDKTINPEVRLSFAPCAAPFIMSFGELNKCVLRDEPT